MNIQLATPGGLAAAYYDSSWPSTSPVLQRVDSTIGVDLARDADGSNSGFSSVRWSGRLMTSISGLHTFYVTSASGTRFWIDGVLTLDRWTSYCNLTSVTFTLRASALHLLQFDAKLPPDASPIDLQWASSAFSRQPIPSVQLFATDHVAGSPFDLLVAPAAACAAKSTAVLRGVMRLYACVSDIVYARRAVLIALVVKERFMFPSPTCHNLCHRCLQAFQYFQQDLVLS